MEAAKQDVAEKYSRIQSKVFSTDCVIDFFSNMLEHVSN